MLEGCSLSPDGTYSASEDANCSRDNGKVKSGRHRSLSDFFPEGPLPGDLTIYTDAMSSLFGVLVALPGLRRAPGPQGHLRSVPFAAWHGQSGRTGDNDEGQTMYMTSDRTSFWPVPTTMSVMWDAK